MISQPLEKVWSLIKIIGVGVKKYPKSSGFTPTPKGLVRGFTLLELIVTVGIVGLLVAMGVPAFYAYSRQNAPRTAAQDIKSFLLEAQSLSKAPAAEDMGTDFYYVTINLNPDDSGNQMVLGKGIFTANGSIGTTNVIKNYKLDTDAQIHKLDPELNQSLSLYFLVPTGEILFNGFEPYPGFGYSKKCQPMTNDCHYHSPYDKSIIQIISSADVGVSDLTVIVDGHGGNINVVDQLVNLTT